MSFKDIKTELNCISTSEQQQMRLRLVIAATCILIGVGVVLNPDLVGIILGYLVISALSVFLLIGLLLHIYQAFFVKPYDKE